MASRVTMQMVLELKANAVGAVGAFDDLQKEMKKTIVDAKALEKELDRLDREHVDISIRLEAIDKTRAEIARLRHEIAEHLFIDIDADVTPFQKKIRELEAKLKQLDTKEFRAQVKVHSELEDDALEKLVGEANRVVKEAQLLTPDLKVGMDVDKNTMGQLQRELTQTFGGISTGILEAGTHATNDIIRMLSRAILAGGPEVAAAITGVLIAAASLAALAFLGAFGAAVAAGVGGLGITAAIVGAFRDPAIQEAGRSIGDSLLKELAGLGDLVKDDVVDALKSVGFGLRDLIQDLRPAIDALGPSIRLLGEGVARSFEILGPALEKLMLSAKPLLDWLGAEGLPMLAEAFAQMFNIVSMFSPGFLLAFKFLVTDITALLYVFNTLLGIAGAFFSLISWIVDSLAEFRQWLHDIGGAWEGIAVTLVPVLALFGDATKATLKQKGATYGLAQSEQAAAEAAQAQEKATADLARQMEKLRKEAEQTAKELDNLFNQKFDTRMGLDQALNDLAKGWRELRKELKDGKRSLDTNTDAGSDNVDAVLSQLSAIKRVRDAQLAMGVSLDEVNRKYSKGVQGIKDMLLQMGFAPAAVDKLVAKYKDIPGEVSTEFRLQLQQDKLGLVAAELIKLGYPVEKVINPKWVADATYAASLTAAGADLTKYIKPVWFADPAYAAAVQAAGMPEKKVVQLQIQGGADKHTIDKLNAAEGFTGKALVDLRLSATGQATKDELQKLNETVLTPPVQPKVDPAALGVAKDTLNKVSITPYPATFVPKVDSASLNLAIAILNGAATARYVKVIPYIDQTSLGNVRATLNSLNSVSARVFAPSVNSNSGGTNLQPNLAPQVNLNFNDARFAELVDAQIADQANAATRVAMTKRVVSR